MLAITVNALYCIIMNTVKLLRFKPHSQGKPWEKFFSWPCHIYGKMMWLDALYMMCTVQGECCPHILNYTYVYRYNPCGLETGLVCDMQISKIKSGIHFILKSSKYL